MQVPDGGLPHGAFNFIATPSTVVADGKTAVALTVILSPDDFPAGTRTGQPVTLTSTMVGDTFAPGVTNSHGVYTTALSSTVAGPRMLTAQVGSRQLTRSVSFIAAPAACAGTLLLSGVPTMKVGHSPKALARADFNQDGKFDIVVTTFGSASVLLGNGDGTFRPRVDYPVDQPPSGGTGFFIPIPEGVATGDFDGDGDIDIVTANLDSLPDHGQISVLLNHGDGTFADAVNSALNIAGDETGGFWAIAVGDLNGDHKADLAVTQGINSSSAILIGKGDGTFAAPVRFSAQSDLSASASEFGVVIADFDGDGKQDVGLAIDLSPVGGVEVHLGNGDGTFKDAVLYAVGDSPQTLAFGDFNGDGKLDLTTGDNGSVASVLLGKGDGTFGSLLSYPTGPGLPSGDLPVDLNGDGKDDLVVTNSHGVSSLLGNGDGTFQSAVGFNAGGEPIALIDGDFDGDGKVDVATANFLSDNMTLLLGRGDGSFVQPATCSTGVIPYGLTTSDLDGDGQLDIVTTNRGGNDISVLLGKGDGTFTAATSYPVGEQPQAVVSGDFDGDGHPDLATADTAGNSVSVLISRGDGTFSAAVGYPVGVGPYSLVTGDFNGDDALDIATSDLNDGTASVLLGNGDGTFKTLVAYPVGAGTVAIYSIDLSGDGKLDLVLANQINNVVSVLLGKGDGTFSGAVNYPTGQTPVSVAAADLNGDGHPDLVSVDYKGAGVTVLLNRGDGTFKTGVGYPSGVGAAEVAIADLDGDGMLDLAVTNAGDSFATSTVIGYDTVSVLHGNGDGSFQAAVDYPVGGSPIGVVGGDFNGDGRVDLIVANTKDNTLSALLATGCVPFSEKILRY